MGILSLFPSQAVMPVRAGSIVTDIREIDFRIIKITPFHA
jgi:hypothetical protein